jgi:hypothetical protein
VAFVVHLVEFIRAVSKQCRTERNSKRTTDQRRSGP